MGLPYARNHGIKKSVGRYVVHLDSDDCIRITYFRRRTISIT